MHIWYTRFHNGFRKTDTEDREIGIANNNSDRRQLEHSFWDFLFETPMLQRYVLWIEMLSKDAWFNEKNRHGEDRKLNYKAEHIALIATFI